VAHEFSTDNLGKNLLDLISKSHSSEEVLQEIKDLTKQVYFICIKKLNILQLSCLAGLAK